MSTKRFQFDPAAAMAADEQATTTALENELDELDNEVSQLSGKIINLARKEVEGLQADDDQPLETQRDSARRTVSRLQAMLNGAKGASSTTLTSDEQEVIDLLRAGTIFVASRDIDDPANPSQRMSIRTVIDPRMRRRRDPNPAPAPTPAPAAPAQADPAQPSSPASPTAPTNPSQPAPAAPASGSTGDSGTAPADPADPAQSNASPPAPQTGSEPDTTPPKSLIKRGINWIRSN